MSRPTTATGKCQSGHQRHLQLDEQLDEGAQAGNLPTGPHPAPDVFRSFVQQLLGTLAPETRLSKPKDKKLWWQGAVA